MGMVLIIMAIVFVLGPIAKAYADRLSRALPADAEAQRLELARVKEELDRLSLEMARMQEEQSFLLKLLNEGDRMKLLKDPKDDAG